MLCPVCKNKLIVVEYHQIELDYCTTCKGVWFDSMELELLLKSFQLENPDLLFSNMLTYPEFKSDQKQRKCPICNKNMKLVNIGDNQNIIIDVCGRGDGIWFDGNEVVQLIKQLTQKHQEQSGTQGTQKVFNFLGEVFHI